MSRKYKDVQKDLHNLCKDIFMSDDNSSKRVIVCFSDYEILNMEVEDPSKGHCIYGITIECGETKKPKLIEHEK